MVQGILRNDRRLSFCEVMHFEAIRRKQDSTYQDVAFFRRRFVEFDGKKGEAGRSRYLIRIKMWCFLEDVSLPSLEKKGDPGAAALYGGKGKTHRIAFMAKLTDRGYL